MSRTRCSLRFRRFLFPSSAILFFVAAFTPWPVRAGQPQEPKTLVRIAEHGKGARPFITEDGTRVFYAFDGALWRKDVATGKLDRVLASEEENISVKGISRDAKRILVDWIDRSTRRTRTCLVDLP